MANTFYIRSKGRYVRTDFLTVREFSTSVGVSQMTIWRWVHEGLPASRVGDEVSSVTMIPKLAGRGWVREKKGRPKRARR